MTMAVMVMVIVILSLLFFQSDTGGRSNNSSSSSRNRRRRKSQWMLLPWKKGLDGKVGKNLIQTLSPFVGKRKRGKVMHVAAAAANVM